MLIDRNLASFLGFIFVLVIFIIIAIVYLFVKMKKSKESHQENIIVSSGPQGEQGPRGERGERGPPGKDLIRLPLSGELFESKDQMYIFDNIKRELDNHSHLLENEESKIKIIETITLSFIRTNEEFNKFRELKKIENEVKEKVEKFSKSYIEYVESFKEVCEENIEIPEENVEKNSDKNELEKIIKEGPLDKTIISESLSICINSYNELTAKLKEFDDLKKIFLKPK